MNLKNIIEYNTSIGQNSAFICINRKDYTHLIKSFEREGISFSKTGFAESYERLLTDFLSHLCPEDGIFVMVVTHTLIALIGTEINELQFYTRNLEHYINPDKSPWDYKDWHTYNITNYSEEIRNEKLDNIIN